MGWSYVLRALFVHIQCRHLIGKVQRELVTSLLLLCLLGEA